jgi:hypothetical protein
VVGGVRHRHGRRPGRPGRRAAPRPRRRDRRAGGPRPPGRPRTRRGRRALPAPRAHARQPRPRLPPRSCPRGGADRGGLAAAAGVDVPGVPATAGRAPLVVRRTGPGAGSGWSVPTSRPREPRLTGTVRPPTTRLVAAAERCAGCCWPEESLDEPRSPCRCPPPYRRRCARQHGQPADRARPGHRRRGRALERSLPSSARTRRLRLAAADRPAGWLFRPLAALGGLPLVHAPPARFHTPVSHVRGPAQPSASTAPRSSPPSPSAWGRVATRRSTSRCCRTPAR